MTAKDSKKAGKFKGEGKELLCGRFHFRMFGKIRVVNDDKRTNLIEFKCKECSRAVNKQFSCPPGTEYEVFHYFDMEGNLVESELKQKKIDRKKEVRNNNDRTK